MTNPNASALGKLGGERNTDAQAEAARRNGKIGGRPPTLVCVCGASGRDVSRWKDKRDRAGPMPFVPRQEVFTVPPLGRATRRRAPRLPEA